MSTIVEIKTVDPRTDELVLSDGRSIRVWNYKAAAAAAYDEADGEIAIGSSLVKEEKGSDGATLFLFYSVKTMYVLEAVKRRYPKDVEHAKELINLGWTTDIDEEVDMANDTPGEHRGPGGTQCAGGFRWYPPVVPQGKITVKGTEEDDDVPFNPDVPGDPEGYYPEPDPDDFHPAADGPVFVSLDVAAVPAHYSSDRDDEENRDD
jgi:hypothetical protein